MKYQEHDAYRLIYGCGHGSSDKIKIVTHRNWSINSEKWISWNGELWPKMLNELEIELMSRKRCTKQNTKTLASKIRIQNNLTMWGARD